MTNLDLTGDLLQIHYDYLIALEKAGAIPLCAPPGIKKRDIPQALKRCDGILLIGGRDYDPRLWGEEMQPDTVLISLTRQKFDINFAHCAQEAGIPILGICGGHQLINIAAGGTLFTSLETQIKGALVHRSRSGPFQKAYHPVSVDRTSRLLSELGSTDLEVNSFHHQAVKDPGRGLQVTARAPDGVIEAIEGIDKPVFGVQWHPEKELSDPVQMKIFKKFVVICREQKSGIRFQKYVE